MSSGKQHPGGYELPDRGDGLHWLRCVECGRVLDPLRHAGCDLSIYPKVMQVCGLVKP